MVHGKLTDNRACVYQRKRSQVGRKAMRRRQKQQMLEHFAANAISLNQANDVARSQTCQNKTKQRAFISNGIEKLEAELSPTEDISLWLDDLAV